MSRMLFTVLVACSLGFLAQSALAGEVDFVRTDKDFVFGLADNAGIESTVMPLFRIDYYCGRLPRSCERFVDRWGSVLKIGVGADSTPLINPDLPRTETFRYRACYDLHLGREGNVIERTKKWWNGDPKELASLRVLDCEYDLSTDGQFVIVNDSGVQERDLHLTPKQQQVEDKEARGLIKKQEGCDLLMYYRSCPRP